MSLPTIIKTWAIKDYRGISCAKCGATTGRFAFDTQLLCNKCHTMKIKDPQRFGRLVKSYGDFGELRKQKKEPHVEVFYIPVEAFEGTILSFVLRSLNNCSGEQITKHVARVGRNLEAGNLKQDSAEFILDLCYAELHRRIGREDQEKQQKSASR
jgi:hypothetical protein